MTKIVAAARQKKRGTGAAMAETIEEDADEADDDRSPNRLHQRAPFLMRHRYPSLTEK